MAEDGGAGAAVGGALHEFAEAGAVKYVVAENKRAAVAMDKLFADDERLGDTVGLWLQRITDVDAPLAAVTQKGFEPRHFWLGRNDENVANSRKHQRRQRIIDHRLVVDRQQLLCADNRQAPQARSGTHRE